MVKKMMGVNPKEATIEVDQFAIEYKLKLISFQDEIFEARRKLTASETRLADLQSKLDNYLSNKEHQLAEITFTAQMNAQRIEAQARTQTENIIMEIDEELRRKQQELRQLQNKTHQYLQTINDSQELTGKQAGASLLPFLEDNVTQTQEQVVAAPKIKIVKADKEQVELTVVADNSQPSPEMVVAAPSPDQAVVIKKRRVVAKKSNKARPPEDQVQATAPADSPEEIPDQSPPEIAAVKPEELVAEAQVAADLEANIIEIAPLEEPRQPAAKQEDLGETMRLDAFVDVRYFDKKVGRQQIHHHALQVAVEVDVPEDNYSVRYTKVSSDIVSALLRFDNIILNDVFPFDIIEPDLQSISMYFYNCLEDILAMMDLGLRSINVLEIPDVNIQVRNRNTSLDNLLHNDADEFSSLRETLRPCVEPEPDENLALKDRLNKMFKRR